MHALQTLRSVSHKPRSIGALIALYESNFVRFMRLVPELDRLDGTLVSRVEGATDLYLSVLERFRYTTTVCLTYRFADPIDEDVLEPYVLEPRARIRIYHDVRAADVISHCRRRAYDRVYPWRRGHMPELYRKWTLNRFLYKWLGFCFRQGHLFLRCTSRPADLSAAVEVDGADALPGLAATSVPRAPR